MAWALYSNRTQQVHGTSFRLDHDSSLKPKPIMWLLNLKSYVVIEFEILAACWAISKCKLFFSGLPHFTVITDHNPLIPIINNHRLDEIENPYLQRLKTKLMAYNFTAQWQQCNNAPDALSRHPVWDPQPANNLAEREVHNNLEMSFTKLRAIRETHNEDSESLHLQELRKHAEQDQEYQPLRTFILDGFPSSVNSCLNPADDTGMSTSNYPWMMTLSYTDADFSFLQRCVARS